MLHDLNYLEFGVDNHIRNTMFQKLVVLLDTIVHFDDIKGFIIPVCRKTQRILSDKQKNIISRYISSFEMELDEKPLVQFMECFQSDKFNALNVEIDGWYQRLAVSETRMDQIMETYEHIRNCLKQDEKYLFTGTYIADKG